MGFKAEVSNASLICSRLDIFFNVLFFFIFRIYFQYVNNKSGKKCQQQSLNNHNKTKNN